MDNGVLGIMDPYGNVYHINCDIMVLTVVKRYDYNIIDVGKNSAINHP